MFTPPPVPPADDRDRDAAHTVAFHPEQGWSLLCNGVIRYDDMARSFPTATGSTGRGCRRAAPDQPPTRSTGAAADEIRPHQGTLRTIRTLGTGARRR